MQPIIDYTPIQQFPSGDQLSLQVYKFIGMGKGKKVYIQANLHGAEIVGNIVIQRLIEYLKTIDLDQLQGEIWLVPLCNPVATNQRQHFFSTGRFNAYDGRDWNRIFWDFNGIDFPWSEFIEESIDLTDEEIQTKFIDVLQLHLNGAHALDSPRGLPFYQQYRYLLQLLSLDANITIDIHSSSNNAIDHLYYFPHQKEAMALFLMNYGILCGEGGYSGNSFNETFLQPWLKLQDLFAARDREINVDRQAWTLELGNGMDVDAKTVKQGFRGITNYLYHQGVLATTPQEAIKEFKTESYLAKNIREYYAIAGGIITDVAPLGTKIKEGEQIYTLMTFDKDGSCPREKIVRSLERGVVFDRLSNYSVHQGDCVVSLLT